MPAIVYLECARCHHRVSADTPQTLCPVDAGLLYVRYDMDALKKSAWRERPAELAAVAGASPGMWRYADVLPDAKPVTLGEGWTPMIASRRYGGLFLKEEGTNPTGTFRARGLGMAVTMAKKYGLQHLAVSSAGDEAGALAAYATAGQIAAHIFMPKGAPLEDYVEGTVYGANVTVVDGAPSDCVRVMNERIKAQKESGAAAEDVWFDVSAFKEPFRVEGTKTMGYELIEQLGWEYPDAVFCPLGDGVGLIGMWKAFEEMEQLGWVTGKRPRMYVVRKVFPIGARKGELQNTGGLSGGRPDTDDIILNIVRESGGQAVETDDAGILASVLDWAKYEGLLLSPEGAAAAAAYDTLRASGEINDGERVVLFNTVLGLKYTDVTAEAMKLRRPRSLPTSLPVGGIITPV